MAILVKSEVRQIKRYLFTIVCCLLFFFCFLPPVYAERIKDIASFEGVRENQLIGYGIVVGLDGTGDKGIATAMSIANMLQRMGIAVSPNDIKTKNTASVMVTAKLPPFPKPGTRLDAIVSTIGDAKSLQGGTLLMTPLKGPDGKVYAVAQGQVSIGGFIGGTGGTTVQKNFLTTGRVPQGVLIEVEPPFTLAKRDEVRLFLHNPDFTVASEVAKKINENFGPIALAKDPSSIKINIPDEFKGHVVEFLKIIEGLDVSIDIPARVVINERTGTVVIGNNVKLAPAAIAHGNLTIEIRTQYEVSQPPPFSPKRAETVIVPQREVDVKEQKASLMEVSGVTLSEIVRALNALGVTPRDLISILQALKAAGALRAEIEVI